MNSIISRYQTAKAMQERTKGFFSDAVYNCINDSLNDIPTLLNDIKARDSWVEYLESQIELLQAQNEYIKCHYEKDYDRAREAERNLASVILKSQGFNIDKDLLFNSADKEKITEDEMILSNILNLFCFLEE